MIDLTPLDVRKKRGDFRRGLRGYEPQEVDSFLDLVAERLEALVRENLQFRERVHALQQQTEAQTQREEAVRDALVTAQELRTEIREQARVEADRIIKEAQTEARRLLAEAEAEVRTRLRNSERQADHALATLGVLERRRLRFLQSFRQLLERELDVVEVEERRPPLEERSFDLDFGAFEDERAVRNEAPAAPPEDAPAYGGGRMTGVAGEPAASAAWDEEPARDGGELPLDADVHDLERRRAEGGREAEPSRPFDAAGPGAPDDASREGDGLLLYLHPDEPEEDLD